MIARRVREAGVHSEIVPFQSAEAAFGRIEPESASSSRAARIRRVDIGSPRAPQSVFEAGIPVLGICYGEQTMCAQLGGKVEAGHHREFGRAFLDIQDDCALFDGIWAKGTRHQVWMSHGDRVTAIPAGFRIVGTSTGAPFAAIADEARKYLRAFSSIRKWCTRRTAQSCSPISCIRLPAFQSDWTMSAYRERAVEAIREQVGKGKVICALSGGVNSSVAALADP